MTELEPEIRRISDDRDQQISRAMAVLVMSAKTGPNANHLAVPAESVGVLMERIEEGGLWRNGLLDDQEWWDSMVNLTRLRCLHMRTWHWVSFEENLRRMAHVTFIQRLES
jgi:hypothetical protein